MNAKKFGCIVQARLSSSRFPAKILLNGHDKSLLHHNRRLKASKFIDEIIIATTTLQIDDVIFSM